MNLASVSINRAYLQFSHLGIAGLKVAGVNMEKISLGRNRYEVLQEWNIK